MEHIAPEYRNKEAPSDLRSRAISAGFDELGFKYMAYLQPRILINTLNNSYLSDILLTRFLDMRGFGLYLDCHTVQSHTDRRYGMNIQAVYSTIHPTFDEFRYTEGRDLSGFDGKQHDPLMAIITASYAAALVTTFTLSTKMNLILKKPLDFSLFPFAENPLEPGPAKKEVHYKGMFRDKGIYVAGMGGQILTVDALINIFKPNKMWWVDPDKIERSNFNRLLPLAHEHLIGKTKVAAAREMYKRALNGSQVGFIEETIYDKLMIGDSEDEIDIILGGFSGSDNKLNLIALSQRLSEKKEHILIDCGAAPFQTDIVNYLPGVTPCDYCRGLEDIAVVEALSHKIPRCDLLPRGSTVFSNSLGVLQLIEAMKYVDPELGRINTGRISCNLNPVEYEPALLYDACESPPVDAEKCRKHWRTEPLKPLKGRYRIVSTMDTGRYYKEVWTKGASERLVGRFEYKPR